jgi:hypothetical protein
LASTGIVRAGPFFDEALGVRAGHEQKVWVASDRDGHDDAVLEVTDPNGAMVRSVREGGVASVPSAKQFYPGVIELSVSGPYRIEITVGPDRMCLVARYSLTSSG